MKRLLFAAGLVWTLVVAASFFWNAHQARLEQRAIAYQTARSVFDFIVVTRRWNAMHGGVYVPIGKHAQPNIYLDDPQRDLEVSPDLTLTKINPAYMSRQIADLLAVREGIRFHITSLDPIRPENHPTPREERVLRMFERGEQEYGEALTENGKQVFFYMAPLKTEQSCLVCHEHQGFKEGQLRGGISVTLPLVTRVPITRLLIGHVATGLIGLGMIGFFGRQLAQAYDKLQWQAVTDALTGVGNRRSFSERIVSEFDRSRREGDPLAVIMLDVDSFKAFNDTYGHKEGDDALVRIARILLDALHRPADYCARYGGEEFVILLPNSDLEGALLVAEKVRSQVEALAIPHEKARHYDVVTVSLGVSVWQPGDEYTHEELLRRADEALYAAKEKGRNRVESYRAG